jgi:ribosomal-protein-serine acetyltransferase
MSNALPPILRELPEQLMGDRVLLRPYRAGDGMALWEAVDESREHVLPWLPWTDKHQTPADSEVWVRNAQSKWILREDLGFGVWDRVTGRYLGGSGLHRMNWEVPAFEIGYWLRRTAVGQGYMTEAAWMLCRFAFEQMSANRVLICCGVGNHRSAAIPRRLGFVLEGTLRNEQRDTNGELYDMLVFSMTPQDFAAALQKMGDAGGLEGGFPATKAIARGLMGMVE